MKIIIPIADAVGKLGGTIGEIASIGKGLYELKKELEKVAEDNNEGNIIDQFMTEIESKTGSIYQKDMVTVIIRSILKRLQDSESDIRTILVIDDLDRIDPEHLFRILNILTAHNDIEDETSNKFGFDKIITVFDVDNVKKIFYSKYGLNVDFIGYISKFYSKEVFHFDIAWEITEKLFDIFRDATIENTEEEVQPFWNSHAYQRIMPVLILLIQKRIVSIRDLRKTNKKLKANEIYAVKFNQFGNSIRWNPNYPYFIMYDFLVNILGGRHELRKVLNELKEYDFQYFIKQINYKHNLDLEQIFIDYISLCLGAVLNKDNQYVDSDLLNLKIYYNHWGEYMFRINGAFQLTPPPPIKMSTNGVPQKYDMSVSDIQINVWEILIEIINKLEEKIYS